MLTTLPCNFSSESCLQLLRQAPLFATLDEATLRELARHTRYRRFPAEEILFRQDEPGHALYIVLSGMVNLQRVAPSGEILPIAQCGPGELLGELALIDGKPHIADARTACVCELLMLERDAFLHCLTDFPQIGAQVMQSLARRLRQMADALERHQQSGILARTARILVERIEAEGRTIAAPNAPLRLRVRQQEVAARIHASRKSVNRALAAFKAEGVLASEGHTLLVLDLAKLRRYAEG